MEEWAYYLQVRWRSGLTIYKFDIADAKKWRRKYGRLYRRTQFDLPQDIPELDPVEAATSFTTFGTMSVKDVENIRSSASVHRVSRIQNVR